MLLPTAIGALMVIAVLIQVAGAQRAIADELTGELATISELRRDLGRGSQLVAGLRSPRARDDFQETAASIDANLARLQALDKSGEGLIAEQVSSSWRDGRAAAERSLGITAGGADTDRSRAVRLFDAAAVELASLDELSREALQSTAESSSSTSRRIVIVAAGIGILATAVNLILIRRLLAATSRPLRQLTDGVAGFSVDDLDHRIEVHGDREFQAVGLAFNSMATRLQAVLQSLEHQAFHDSLTGLGNRASLLRRLEAPGASRAVLLLDLDDFKSINDGLGHAAGDEALVQIGHRLQRSVRPEDLVARLGGDEFGVVLEDAAPVEAVTARIIAAVADPVEIAGRPLVLQASGGIAFVDDTQDPAETIRRADIALYVAKEAGKGCARVFQSEMLQDAERRLELETDLREAIARGEIGVHYQPTVSTQTGRVSGVEALARWHHPKHGPISPLTFIPIAEATGQILALGRHVLATACRQAREWQRLAGLEQLSVSVNVSASQLHDPAILDDVAGALRDFDLAPTSLTLEITETVMADPEAVARLHQLKAIGVRIALDDFGTGYSSLSYLQRLPIDVLKIDKSFVDDLDTIVDRAVLASAIVRLGRALGFQTVAEGVERADQLETLTQVGCDVVQGYLIARPLSAADTEAGLLALTAARPARLQTPDLTLIHVELGPLPAEPAREWLRHAHWAIDELEAGKLVDHVTPASVIGIMRDFVDRWTIAAMPGDTFHWASDEDSEVLSVLLRYWQPVSRALAEASENGAFFISQAAAAFSASLVNTLLIALATQSNLDVDAAALARALKG